MAAVRHGSARGGRESAALRIGVHRALTTLVTGMGSLPTSVSLGGGAPQHLDDEERELERLLGVQPRVARGVVAGGELAVRDHLRAAEALRDVLAGVLDVDAAGMRTESLMDLEEALDLVHDAVEVPRLMTARRLLGVAVHRIALPHDAMTGPGHGLDDRRQRVADRIVAHP